MRIAFICDPRTPNGWYRGKGPMAALARRGHEVRELRPSKEPARLDLVRGCDVLHVHRDTEAAVLSSVLAAKEMGIAVVWDNDDNETAVPKGHPAHRAFGGLAGERIRTATRRMVREAHLVTTPSSALARHYQDLGAERVLEIENYVRNQLLDVPSSKRRDEVVVGWAAGGEHYMDVERVPIKQALGRLLDTYAHVRVVSVGVKLGLEHARYEHVPGLPFRELPSRIADFDIGIAVLADIPFNHFRSNVKVKEYAALGIPWLASPIGPYAGMGEQQGGRAVPDEGWSAAIGRLVAKPRERRKLAKAATRWGREQVIEKHAERWEQALHQAMAQASRS